jgi:hypothetical protein
VSRQVRSNLGPVHESCQVSPCAISLLVICMSSELTATWLRLLLCIYNCVLSFLAVVVLSWLFHIPTV